jgi:hypothetical protein
MVRVQLICSINLLRRSFPAGGLPSSWIRPVARGEPSCQRTCETQIALCFRTFPQRPTSMAAFLPGQERGRIPLLKNRSVKAGGARLPECRSNVDFRTAINIVKSDRWHALLFWYQGGTKTCLRRSFPAGCLPSSWIRPVATDEPSCQRTCETQIALCFRTFSKPPTSIATFFPGQEEEGFHC